MDVIIKADDISADDFKEALEEDQVEGCNIEQVKTEFEDEDKIPLMDTIQGERFNACYIEKVKTKPAEFVDEVFKEDKKESVPSL